MGTQADTQRLRPPPHHCFSQGMPSPFPSICTPGQFLRKNVASSQEVICEQSVRPSHRNLVSAGPGVDVPGTLDVSGTAAGAR